MGRNVLLIQAWLLVTAVILTVVWQDNDGLDLPGDYLEVSVLAAVGYLPYLGLVYLLPGRWAPAWRRAAAVVLSPLVMMFMFLPVFLPFALVCGATIWLPDKGKSFQSQ